MDNIVCGFEKGTRKDLITSLGVARDSTNDVASMLSTIESWTIFSSRRAEVSGLRNETERILRLLNGWIEHLTSPEHPAAHRPGASPQTRYPTKHEQKAFWEAIDHINRLDAAKENSTKK